MAADLDDDTPGEVGRPWHQAIAFVLTGERIDGLGLQLQPDVAALVEDLRERGVALAAGSGRDRGSSAIPADLATQLPPAQLAAAVRRALAMLAERRPAARHVSPARPLTPAERRLQDEVPPHHGG